MLVIPDDVLGEDTAAEDSVKHKEESEPQNLPANANAMRARYLSKLVYTGVLKQ